MALGVRQESWNISLEDLENFVRMLLIIFPKFRTAKRFRSFEVTVKFWSGFLMRKLRPSEGAVRITSETTPPRSDRRSRWEKYGKMEDLRQLATHNTFQYYLAWNNKAIFNFEPFSLINEPLIRDLLDDEDVLPVLKVFSKKSDWSHTMLHVNRKLKNVLYQLKGNYLILFNDFFGDEEEGDDQEIYNTFSVPRWEWEGILRISENPETVGNKENAETSQETVKMLSADAPKEDLEDVSNLRDFCQDLPDISKGIPVQVPRHELPLKVIEMCIPQVGDKEKELPNKIKEDILIERKKEFDIDYAPTLQTETKDMHETGKACPDVEQLLPKTKSPEILTMSPNLVMINVKSEKVNDEHLSIIRDNEMKQSMQDDQIPSAVQGVRSLLQEDCSEVFEKLDQLEQMESSELASNDLQQESRYAQTLNIENFGVHPSQSNNNVQKISKQNEHGLETMPIPDDVTHFELLQNVVETKNEPKEKTQPDRGVVSHVCDGFYEDFQDLLSRIFGQNLMRDTKKRKVVATKHEEQKADVKFRFQIHQPPQNIDGVEVQPEKDLIIERKVWKFNHDSESESRQCKKKRKMEDTGTKTSGKNGKVRKRRDTGNHGRPRNNNKKHFQNPYDMKVSAWDDELDGKHPTFDDILQMNIEEFYNLIAERLAQLKGMARDIDTLK